MNEIVELRTRQINNFIASFDNLNDVNVKDIEEGLHSIIGEKPGIDFEYGVDYILNEATGEEDRKHELKKIHVLYSYIDDNGNPKIGKMSYIVG
jgi:hypothetical protein